MITVHAIRLESAPALLLLKDGRDTVAVINNRTDVEILLAAIYAGAEVLWPPHEPEAAEDAPKPPPRSWACKLGDDCDCYINGVTPVPNEVTETYCDHYGGAWGSGPNPEGPQP